MLRYLSVALFSLCLACGSGWSEPANAFDLDDFKKQLDKAKKEFKKQKTQGSATHDKDW